MNTKLARTEAHQAAVMERRRSGATTWDTRPKHLRTRSAALRAAKKDQEDR